MSTIKQPGELARKTYAGFFWQMLGFSLNTILSVAHIVIMARLLTPDIFGQFAIAGIIIALTATVTEFGLGPALVQKNNVTKEDVSFVFIFNIVSGLTLFSILILYSDNISAAFNGTISPLMVKVLALNLLVRPIGLASKSLLLRKMDFQHIFIATNLAYLIGMLLVGVSLAILGYGIWSLIIGLIVTSAVSSLYFIVVSRISLSFKFNREDSRYLFRYGLGQSAVEGVNQSSMMADKLILSQLASSTFLGIYERSQRIQQMPGVFIGGVMDSVLFSTLSKFSSNKPLLARHFFNIVTIAFLIGVYISVMVFTFAKIIVLIVLGDQWLDATFVLQMLSLLIGLQLLSRLGDSYVRATGAFKKSLVVKVCYLIVVFAFALVGYQIKHVNGALVGIVLAGVIHTVLMIYICQKDSQYSNLELWKRLKPGLIFASMLVIKNLVITQFVSGSVILTIAIVLFTDLLVVLLMLHSTILMGLENKAFIFTRIDEVKSLLKKH